MFAGRLRSCRKTASLVVQGLVLVLLVSCGGTKEVAEEVAEVHIGTMGDAVDYAPYMVARSKGWFEEAFKKHGVETVDYTTFQALPALNEALGTRRIDIAFEAEPPAIIGRAAGIDLRIVGISCSLTQEILVRSDSTINQVADLRGKKATVPAGTSSHYNLLSILSSGGVSDNDVQIIDMSPPDARNAFETGQVDAWAIWPPWVEQEIVAGKGRVLPGATARINSVMSIRGQFQDEHSEIAQAAFDVLEQSKSWIRQHPKEAEEIVAKALKLDFKVIELAWPKHDWTAELNEEIATDIQRKADFLKEREIIKQPVNVRTQLIFPLSSSK
jgi:sulfonate transport system substrate-binding protein